MSAAHPHMPGRAGRLAGTVILLLLVAAVLFPLALMALNALKTHAEVVSNPLALPQSPSLDAFARAWSTGQFGHALINSVIITAVTVALTTGTAAMAAWPLARKAVRGWRIIMLYFLATVAVPIQLFLFPLFFVYAKLGLVSNPVATAVILSAVNLPVAILLLRSFALSIPAALDEAAYMEGAGNWQVFRLVILPLMRPGLVTVAILTGFNAWNEYLITQTFQQSQSSYTVMLAFLSMNSEIASDKSLMMAGAVIVIAPLLIFFLLMQRLFVDGVTRGAVKG
ncbi:carbohydrate ABC transporter permease [Salipiger sp. PrR002]|uniref:carbohydrate ABC transporter permease n=1 Tax=Salipiger sp. PrR002 TaxID=2706489 RepID=UPI0013BA7119|nr:carbohydrate ABC transporter permease [Salipiger sp. PrR002]NDW00081.1 carbohydrate ABC transporter permease [Salipiger sp. PrR002]NDW56910.1 carbohydrate ABC transporter permease [Salipiger sp. PrR004]